jgi:hypothetical protein
MKEPLGGGVVTNGMLADVKDLARLLRRIAVTAVAQSSSSSA